MIYRKIPGTDLSLSILGYGGWGAGIKGWQNVNEKKVRESIALAYSLGINFFDTAPVYGGGKSEEILGDLLHSCRKQVILATKFGLIEGNYGKIQHNLHRDSILFELEQSLRRLKTDYIDLYQIHFPDPQTLLSTVFPVLEELQQEGVIRQYGVSNFSLKQLKENQNFHFKTIQNRFNYLHPEDKEELLPFCQRRQLGYIAYSPLSQGLLTDSIHSDFRLAKKDIRRFNPIFSDERQFQRAIAAKEAMPADKIGTALQFVLSRQAVVSALVTMTRPEHVKSNVNSIQQIFSS